LLNCVWQSQVYERSYEYLNMQLTDMVTIYPTNLT
jgi:hypothetical protein